MNRRKNFFFQNQRQLGERQAVGRSRRSLSAPFRLCCPDGRATPIHRGFGGKRRRAFLAICLVSATFVCMIPYCREIYHKSADRGHVWRAHLSTGSKTWDAIHGATAAGQSHEGGVWKYTFERIRRHGVVRYLIEQRKMGGKSGGGGGLHVVRYLDVACNVGYFLQALCQDPPTKGVRGSASATEGSDFECYGTDISQVMVEKTHEHCPTCHAHQFDLGLLRQRDYIPFGGVSTENKRAVNANNRQGLQSSSIGEEKETGQAEQVELVGQPDVTTATDGISRIADDFPTTFDYVIVSDVLIYIPWGGYAPLLLVSCTMCRHTEAVVQEQQRFVRNLRRIASKEVIISSHQKNPIVVDMMDMLSSHASTLEEGAGTFSVTWNDGYDIWTIPSTPRSGG